MPCPTCDHTMQVIGNKTFWCPRCGTIKNERIFMPMLAIRVGLLKKAMQQSRVGFNEWDKQMWHSIGIDESIDIPANRGR